MEAILKAGMLCHIYKYLFYIYMLVQTVGTCIVSCFDGSMTPFLQVTFSASHYSTMFV